MTGMPDKHAGAMGTPSGLVSVVIPTRNSEKTIGLCLESIKRQTYRDVEIIVVDSNSEDGTGEIAKRYGKLCLKASERSPARNYGAKVANGSFLAFIDSDMELEPEVIEACVREITQKGNGAVIIPEVSVGEGFWADCKALERSCYIGDDDIEAARFFARDVFMEINGYDENLVSGEDWDLSQRAKTTGYGIGRVKPLIKHHEGRLSLPKTMKKKYYYAGTIRNYMQKNPEMAKKQIVLIRPAYIRNWKRLIRDPLHTTGFMFMKCCEFGAGGLGYVMRR